MFLKLFYVHKYTQKEKKYLFIIKFKITENTKSYKKKKKV